MIKYLIFDLDGTLFDSSKANLRAYSLAFEEIGVPFERQKYLQNFGLRFNEMMDTISPGLSDEQKNNLKKLKSTYYKQNLDLVIPNEGLLAILKSGAFSAALVTTASKINVTNLLSHFNVPESLFRVIVTGEDVSAGKPEPECYTLALSKLSAQPEECCVFEDSESGIQAATAAGIKVVKITI